MDAFFKGGMGPRSGMARLVWVVCGVRCCPLVPNGPEWVMLSRGSQGPPSDVKGVPASAREVDVLGDV